MKSRKRRLLAMLLAASLALSLAACGVSRGGESMTAAASDCAAPGAPAPTEEGLGAYDNGAVYEKAEMDAEAPETAGEDGAKIIHTAYLELETTEFDQAAAALADLAKQMEGYFESSTVGDRGGGYRWAEYTVRVPAERYESFLNQAGELCHETWRNTEQKNISEVYYDTAGRLKTQQIKLERLQALLQKADNMADIITIESAISETEWMIEDLSGTLRHYDAQVDCATVTISLQEVYKLSNVEEAPQSFAGRLGSAFSGGWDAFVDGLENLAVALAYGWVWVLLLAVIAVLVVRVVRKRKGSFHLPTRKKKDDKPE